MRIFVLCLVIVAGQAIAKDSDIARLSEKPVSMLDWGSWKMQSYLARKLIHSEGRISTDVFFEQDQQRLMVQITVPAVTYREGDERATCGNYINVVRESLFVDPSSGEALFGEKTSRVPSFFLSQGEKALPAKLAADLDASVFVNVNIMSHQNPFATKLQCEGALRASDIKFSS